MDRMRIGSASGEGNHVARGPARRPARSRAKSDGNHLSPEIEFDSNTHELRVRDPRIINSSQRAFCRRLLETVASRPGISKAEVHLSSASCRVQFADIQAAPRRWPTSSPPASTKRSRLR